VSPSMMLACPVISSDKAMVVDISNITAAKIKRDIMFGSEAALHSRNRAR
jgi:hypothetical protein